MLHCKNMDEIYILIGQRVYQRRKELKMKQKELAAKTNLSTTYIRKIEYGQTCITIKVLHALCLALDLEVHELLVFEKEKPVAITTAKFLYKLEQMSPEEQNNYILLLKNLIEYLKLKYHLD